MEDRIKECKNDLNSKGYEYNDLLKDVNKLESQVNDYKNILNKKEYE